MSDIKGVHCPLDFSDTSRHALAQAAAVAGWYKARLAALHAYSPMFMPIPGLPAPANRVPEFEQQLKSATNRLESFASDAIRDRCAVTARVSHGKPYVEILRVAADKGADLIVLGVHGRKVIDLAMFGATINQVVRRATCSVLTLRR